MHGFPSCARRSPARCSWPSWLAAAFLAAVFTTAPPLPRVVAQTPTLSADVGGVPASGSSNYVTAAGTYQLTGTGAGPGGTADAFHFAYYQVVGGDGQMVVRLASADAPAQAALVVRGSLEADAASAAVVVSGASVQFVRRLVSGRDSVAGSADGVSSPVWLKLARSGGTISAAVSPDGQTWTSLGSDTLDLEAASLYVGLAVSNGSASSVTGANASFDGLGSTFLPAQGLRMWLKADAGVTADPTSGTVSSWADQSGHGNDAGQAVTSNQPQRVEAAINGQPVLRFDGSSYLRLPSGFSDFTKGATALLVARPTAASDWQRFFELANGPSVDSIVFGRYSSSSQFLFECVNGNGSLVAEASSNPGVIDLGTAQLFELSQNGGGGTVTLYKNAQALTTQGAGIIANVTRTQNLIGWSNFGNARFQGDLAEMVLFDHALTDAERQMWEAYLNAKYQYDPPPPVPTGLEASPLSATQTLLSWVDAFPNISGYQIERQNPDGSWTVVATPSGHATTFVDSGLTPGASYSYRVSAINSAGSSPASTVAATTAETSGAALPVANLRLWLKADAGTSGSGSVSLWLDQSGLGHDAHQEGSGAQPSAVAGALNGRPVVHFSGSGQYLALPPDTMSGATAGEMFLVLRSTAPANTKNGLATFGTQFYGDAHYPYGDGHIHDCFGSTTSWDTGEPGADLGQFHLYDAQSTSSEWTSRIDGVVQFTSTASGAANTVGFTSAPALGYSDGSFFQGDIAEVLVFDHALSADEREAVGRYLNSIYALAPDPAIPADVTASAVSGTQAIVSWNPAIDSGNVIYTIERKLAGDPGDFVVVAQVADATSFVDAGLTPGANYLYRIRARTYHGQSGYSTEIAVSTPLLAAGAQPLPSTGLRLWLKADAGVSGGNVGLWQDQSGNHNDAHQEGSGAQPVLLPQAVNGRPAIHFDGGDSLALPLRTLANATGGEMFMVVRSTAAAGSATGFAYFGTQFYHQAYYPDISGHLVDSFGSTTAYDTGKPGADLHQFNVYNAVSSAANPTLPYGEWTSRINGVTQFTSLASRTVNVVGFATAPVIGFSDRGFQGDIAEILIFDRALSADERESVGRYLGGRYSLATVPTAPAEVTAKVISATQTSLTWDLAGNQPGIIYTVERETGTSGSFAAIGEVDNAAGFLDAGLEPGTHYVYRVRARNPAGRSAASVECGVDMPAAGTAARPLDLSGLCLWLKADAGTSGGNVGLWQDQSGNRNDAHQEDNSQQPSLIFDAVNGRPAIRFNGGNSLALPPRMMGAAAAGEMFVVLRSSAATGSTNGFVRFGNQFYGESYYPNSEGRISDAFGSATLWVTGKPSADVNEFHLYNAASTDEDWTSRINGVPHFSSRLGGAANPVGFGDSPCLGFSYAYLHGDVAEILVFDHALAPEDREVVERYLNARYGILADGAPAAPVLNAARAISGTQASLTWNDGASAAGDATIYSLERSTGTSGAFAVVAELAETTSYCDGDLTPGATYVYRVRARNAAGVSDYSTPTQLAVPAQGSETLPLDGLRLWLRADAGVNNGEVGLWLDQSGRGNDAHQEVPGARPTLMAGALNGRPAIHFDGSRALALPAATMRDAAAGEMFVVVRSTAAPGTTSGFISLGNQFYSEAYYPDGNGHIRDSFGSTTNWDAGLPGVNLGDFHLYNARSTPNDWTCQLDGVTCFSSASAGAVNTVGFTLNPVLGSSSSGLRGDVAEILVFDHALRQEERLTVQHYLNSKYNYNPPPPAPGDVTAVPLSATEMLLSWSESAQNLAGCRIERQNKDGTWSAIVTLQSGVFTYVDHGLVADTPYTYRIVASTGGGDSAASASATGSTDAATAHGGAPSLDGLLVWLRADAGVVADAQAGNTVSTWLDLSGNGNNAVQTTLNKQPAKVENAANGVPAVRFDGLDDQLRLAASVAENDFAVYVVAYPADTHEIDAETPGGGTGGTSGQRYLLGAMQGEAAQPPLWPQGAGAGISMGTNGVSVYEHAPYYLPAVAVIAADLSAGFSMVELNYLHRQPTLRVNGAYTRSGATSVQPEVHAPLEIGSGTYGAFAGDVAEVLIYDHSLESNERAEVEAYLNAKYHIYQVPAPPSGLVAAPFSASQVLLTWTESALDIDGYKIQVADDEGEWTTIGVANAGDTSYIASGQAPGTMQTLRVVATRAGVESPGAEVAVTFPLDGDSVPVGHLLLWYQAGTGTTASDHESVSRWSDLSGQHHDAVQDAAAKQPHLLADAVNGRSVLRFDGTNSALGLPDGLFQDSTSSEVFVVLRTAAGAGAENGLWRFNDSGNTLYPQGDHLCESFGTQTAHTLATAPAALTQFNLYNVSADAGAWAARLNWQTVLASSTDTVDLSAASYLLGQSRDGQYFAGDIAEILVFKRALSADERAAVNAYLTTRYNLTPALPPAQGLNAVALSPNQVSLAWDYDSAMGDAAFIVKRSVAGSNVFQTLATLSNVGSFVDGSVQPGVSYRYEVFVSAGGTDRSPPSPAVPVYVPPTTQTSGSQAGDLITTYTPDQYGNVATETVVVNGQELVTTYTYDANNNRLTVKDPKERLEGGNAVTAFVYDARNQLDEVDYPVAAGQPRQFKSMRYDADGNKVRETDENGHPTLCTYDGLDRLTSSTRSMNPGPDLVTSYEYNAVNSRTKLTDPRQQATTYTYDALQRLSLMTDTLKRETSYTYGVKSGGSVFDSSSFKPTGTLRTADGHTTTTAYDELYRPTDVYSDAIHVTHSEYDAANNVHLSTDARGQTTEMVHDALDRVVRVNHPDQTYTQAFFTSTGLKWKEVDELFHETEMVYDSAGRLTDTYGAPPDPLNAPTERPHTRTVYDANGSVAATFDALEREWDFSYDLRRRKTDEYQPSVKDYDQNNLEVRPHLHWEYDGVGNVTTATDARGFRTATGYDYANRPTTVTAPAVPVVLPDGTSATRQPQTLTAYDENGNVASVTDANGNVTANAYDAFNQLSSVTSSDGDPAAPQQIQVLYYYDAGGNRARVQDANGHFTYYEYDGLNRNTKITDAKGQATVFSYWDGINKTARQDANGHWTNYDHDVRNRLLHVDYPDRPQDDLSYAYDAAGRLLGVSRADGSVAAAVAYAYDGAGRLASETSNGATHHYGYDLNGRRTWVEYGRQNGGTGRTLECIYDTLGRLRKMLENGDRSTRYHFDLDGHLRSKVLSDGEQEISEYDALGRASATTGTAGSGALLYQYGYGYDAAGNLREMVEHKPGLAADPRVTMLEYDGVDRLRRESVYNGVEAGGSTALAERTSYQYDPAGNRTSKAERNGTTTYVPNELNQVTGFHDTAGRGVSFTYDANGNRLTRTEGAATDAYGYDAENRLISLDKAGTHYAYAYDYRTRRVERVEGAVTTELVFSGGTSVQEYTGRDDAPSVEFIRGLDLGGGGGVGGLLYSLRAGAASFDHCDGRGDVATQTNEAGTITYQGEYEAFGTRRQEFGSDPDRQRASTKEEDPTGLLNEGIRIRDLETGGFTTPDPAGMVDGPNLYAYVRQNPWTKFDPEGLWEWSDIPEFGGAIVVGLGEGVTGVNAHRPRSILERDGRSIGRSFAMSLGATVTADGGGHTIIAAGELVTAGGVELATAGGGTIPSAAIAAEGAKQAAIGMAETALGGLIMHNSSHLDSLQQPDSQPLAGGSGTGNPEGNTANHTSEQSQQAASAETKKPDYSTISDPKGGAEVGGEFTAKQRAEALRLNRETNGGEVRSDGDGRVLTKPEKSRRGVTPDKNEWQFDHKQAKHNGGTNTSSNMQILSREENRQKSNN